MIELIRFFSCLFRKLTGHTYNNITVPFNDTEGKVSGKGLNETSEKKSTTDHGDHLSSTLSTDLDVKGGPEKKPTTELSMPPLSEHTSGYGGKAHLDELPGLESEEKNRTNPSNLTQKKIREPKLIDHKLNDSGMEKNYFIPISIIQQDSDNKTDDARNFRSHGGM